MKYEFFMHLSLLKKESKYYILLNLYTYNTIRELLIDIISNDNDIIEIRYL